jgi:hypothetical protein
MQTRQGSMLQSLRNVEAFLDQHADVLGAVVQTGTRQKLADAIAALSTHVSGQAGSNLASRGATQKHYALRQVLIRRHMAPVARIAAADLPHTPELLPLRMPSRNLPAEKLAAAAYGMAMAAIPFTAVFTAAGLPGDFAGQLTAAADAMTAVLDDRAQERNTQRGATAGLKAKLAAGRKIVHVLDAFVTDAVADDAALLASWNGAKRVRTIPPTPLTPATPPAAPPGPALQLTPTSTIPTP